MDNQTIIVKNKPMVFRCEYWDGADLRKSLTPELEQAIANEIYHELFQSGK